MIGVGGCNGKIICISCKVDVWIGWGGNIGKVKVKEGGSPVLKMCVFELWLFYDV